MGYESNFEVPDIEDTLLRGVDDLTDLLCPDSHPEDYASRGYQGYQGTCVLFCFFSLTLRGFFSRETKKDRRVYERLPGIFSSRNAIGKGKNRFGLSFCPSRVCAWGAKSARGEERCARSQRERDWEGEFFFSFLKFSEKKHGQRLTLFFFRAPRSKPTETNLFQPHQFQAVHVPVHVHGATFAPVQTGLPTAEERARQSAREIRQARKQVRLAAKGKQLLQLKRKAGSEGVQSFGGEAKPTSSTYTDNQDLQVVPDVDTIGRTNNAPATSSEGHSGYLVNSQEQNKDTTTTYLAHTTSAPTTTSIMPPKKKNEDYDDGKELPAMPTGNTAEDERERKRLKRLLRNRVSAQHARERKKAYMNSLENAERERQSRLDELENRCKTLEKENEMLREVIKTYTQKDPSAK